MNKPYQFCNNCGRSGHLFHSCKKPITSSGIACFKKDIQGNLEYYFPIDFESDDSKYYNVNRTAGIVQGEDSDIYYLLAETRRCGFDDEIRLFKVQDSGSSFSLINSYKLSDVSGSPTKLNSEKDTNATTSITKAD